MESDSSHPSLLERLIALVGREPEGREALMQQLHSAFERHVFDADALFIIEGALNVSDIQVRDAMVPRAHIDVVHLDDSLDELVDCAIRTGHSRFPVVCQDKDDVQGILLAKDLLRAQRNPVFRLQDILRPAVFIPESKRLNVLLREFRANHNHMAVVVDEYGGVSGLITIEDVLEQIVGEIEDEYDTDENTKIVQDRQGRYRVKASTTLEAFNEAFGSKFSHDEVDTLGGFVTAHLGHMPQRGESLVVDDLGIKVLKADSRRVLTLLVERLPMPQNMGPSSTSS